MRGRPLAAHNFLSPQNNCCAPPSPKPGFSPALGEGTSHTALERLRTPPPAPLRSHPSSRAGGLGPTLGSTEATQRAKQCGAGQRVLHAEEGFLLTEGKGCLPAVYFSSCR